MPIVTVQCVGSGPDNPDAIQQLADRLGDLFDSEPGTTWVRMVNLAGSDYAENRTEKENAVQPTFVEVLHRALPDEEARVTQARAISVTVAEVLARPQRNVHVIYLPPGAGRVAFGGNLITNTE